MEDGTNRRKEPRSAWVTGSVPASTLRALAHLAAKRDKPRSWILEDLIVREFERSEGKRPAEVFGPAAQEVA